MIEARLHGLTLDQIGELFGVTRERVRQILNKNGGPTAAQVRQLRLASEAMRAEEVADDIRETLRVLGPLTADEVGVLTSLTMDEVRRHWPADVEHMRIRPRTSVLAWSDSDILQAIREASIYEFPLTANAYAELVRLGEVPGPSLPRIGQRFGSWVAACEAAGVEHGQPPRTNYQSRWTDDDLLTYARSYFLDPDVSDSAGAYGAWRRDKAPEAPSSMTLRNRLGTWAEIKRRALGGAT